jgi:hypothetical protein
MKWEDARQASIDKWYAVRDLIGQCEPAEFVHVVHDTHAMCLKSMQEMERAEDDLSDFCHYCPSHTQYGGCHAMVNAMCEAAQFKDWHTVQQLTMNMIGMLENLKVKDETARTTKTRVYLIA